MDEEARDKSGAVGHDEQQTSASEDLLNQLAEIELARQAAEAAILAQMGL